MAFLANSEDCLTQGHKIGGHVDVHVKLIIGGQGNVDGGDLDSLAPLAEVVQLLTSQPVGVDGRIDSQAGSCGPQWSWAQFN